jgi:integrase
MPKRRGLGSVFRRQRRGGGVYPGWFIRWTDAGGTRHQQFAGATRDAAELTLSDKLRERATNRAAGVRTARQSPSLNVALSSILAALDARLRETTARDRKARLHALAPEFGDRPMREISTRDIDALVTRLRARGIAPATVGYYIACLSSAFRIGAQLGYCTVNPCKGASLPRVEQKPLDWLGPGDVARLAAAATPRMRDAIVVLYDTGLRRGELVALQVEDLVGRALHVRRSKSGRPRVVPLTKRAAAILEERAKSGGRLFAWGVGTLNGEFRDAAIAAGMPHVHPHSLRHAYASGLVQAGVDLPTVQRLLGHTKITMTMRYAQWAPADSGVRAVEMWERSRGHFP